MLEGAVASPQSRIWSLPILKEDEKHRVLTEWKGPQVPFPPQLSIGEVICTRVSHAPALISNGEELDYGELVRRVNCMAVRLRARGVGVEDRVAIRLERAAEWLVAALAVLNVGGVFIPLDSSEPARRIAFILQNSGAGWVITEERLGQLFEQSPVQLLYLQKEDAKLNEKNEAEPAARNSSQAPACILYRSGSTGRPEAIVLPLGALRAKGIISESDRVALRLNFSHELIPLEMFSAVAAGACVVELSDLPPRMLADLLRDQAVTVLFVSASILERLSSEFPRSLSKVRLILCGEGIDFLRKLRSSLPADLVGRVFGLYGATEAGGACMMYPVSALDSNAHVMPIGQLAISTSLCVMDEMLNRVPEGMVGEICIGGEGLALGFDRDTVPTTSGRVADSLSPIRGTQLLRTGQLASLRPSGLELRGRRDGLTVIDGMRAGLEEIEAVLLECPDLSSTAVVAHEVSGLGESGLAAFVVAKEGRALSVEDLKDFLKAQLPDYMIPREIVFLTSLPRTPQGEVDRHAVSRLYKEGKGIGSVPQTYVAPRGLVEDSLAKIWAEIFGIVRVGIHDNFFALGGDSILSILAVTRASRVGIQITARQMFERQTIAGLASVAGRVELVAAEQGSVSGPVPLTPAQRWFFEEDFRDKHHFNQAVMLATRERVDASLLKQLVAGLLQQHDALRMRFSQDNGEWRQEIAPQEDVDRVFARVELNAADGALQILMQQASEWQGSLNLQHGPLIRVVLFELGERREQRVLILVHHLLVDGVSWRILLEDLERGCRQLQRGGSVDLPTKTSSFQQWARQLQVYSQAEELKQEAVYWRGISARPIKPLPRDRHIRENTVSSAETVTISIGKEQTRALLQEVPRAYRMRIHEVLLTAFALAVREWTAVDNLRIDLEGHGREEIGGTVDVTRTVGWFTAIFPVYLELQGVSDPGAALKRVKEQMRAVPRRGIGYGILRFLTIEQALDESRSEMIFNYLGQFDRVLDTEGVFQGANESPGVLQSPRAERSYLLEVNAAVQEGQLQVQCVYNVNAHQPKTIENLLNEFSQKLQLLIAHCQTTAVGSHTPSDFPSVNVSQEFLDSLSELGGEIENIYPLVSMQEDMLLQTVKAPHTGVYFEQLSFAVEGLRPEMFERAWQRVMDRHAALRSRFAWMSLDHPVQIVQRRAEINLERQDWNSLQDADPTALLDEFLLRDRARGFDLTQAPLMRLTLIRSRRNDWIVWSFHHIILDGWSGAILMQEVFSSYRALCDGSEPDLGRAADYEAYIGWRQRQSQDKPEQFWRAQLKGFHGPSALRVQDLNEMHPSVDIGRETVQFSDDEVRVLESFARQRQLTLNTVVQGMWSILLSAYTGNPEVMFGAWGSGRSADVLDIEKIVGALINTLPVRVRVDSEAELVAWLKTIQEQQLEQRQHEHINLLKLLAWSEVPGEPLLFNTVLVFENYPVSASLGGQITESGLRIFDVLAREQTHYPIAIRVMPRNNLALLIEYDRCLYTKEMAWRILLDLQRLLQAVAGNPKHRIKNLLPLLRAGLTS